MKISTFVVAVLAAAGLVAVAGPAAAMIPPEPGAYRSYGPYSASVAIDGRDSMSSADRVKTDAYLAGAPVHLYCQDSGESVGGSAIWDYTTLGYWIPDAYVHTGTTGYLSGVPRCLTLGFDGHTKVGSAHGPYTAKVDIDGRGSADPDDRVRVNAYTAGSQVYVKCQDHGITAGGSTLWDYTTLGYWVPDAYVTTGTDGWVPGMPTCSSLGIAGGQSTNPAGGRQFLARTTLNGYNTKSLSASKVVDKYRDGSYITVMCQAYGELNYGGSTVWDKTADGLWVADYYVRTGSTGIVMNRCDNDPASGGSGTRFLARTTLNGYTAKSLSASKVVDKYLGGSYITITCQAYGQFNYGGSAIWDKTSDGLWVADYYIRTGSDDIVVSRCDNDPKPTNGPGNPSVPATPPPGSVDASTMRDAIVAAALSQVGTHEWGDNCNPYGRSGARCGDPWCSMFASWAWRQAGIDVYLPYSGDFYYWGVNHGTVRSQSTVRPGDLVLFGYSTGASNHVGIVADVLPDGRITTIEGNFGDEVRTVGPYKWSDAAAMHPGDGGIYAVVAPLNDGAAAKWSTGSVDTSSGICTNDTRPGHVQYQLCLEYGTGGIRATANVLADRDSVAQASVKMTSSGGTTKSVTCTASLIRTYERRSCSTGWMSTPLQVVWGDATLRLGGVAMATLRAADLKVVGRHQETSTYCGPATVQTALGTMGLPMPSQDSLADQMGTDLYHLTLPFDMPRALNAWLPSSAHQYDDHYWGEQNLPMLYGLDDIRASLMRGHPVIIMVKPQQLPWYGPGGNGLVRHYVLIHGYSSHTVPGGDPFAWDQERFKVWDPDLGANGSDEDISAGDLIAATYGATGTGDSVIIVG